MAKLVRDNLGAQSLDGIDAKVGIKFLDPNRTLLMLPLQDECPTDPDEMLVTGPATFGINQMFKAMKPAVEVSLQTGDEKNPLQDVTVSFNSIKNFEPDDIMQQIPLLKAMKDKQNLIHRLETLMQEAAFQKIMKDKVKKAALINFMRSVLADIEAADPED
jgi:hypothetical protein